MELTEEQKKKAAEEIMTKMKVFYAGLNIKLEALTNLYKQVRKGA